MKYDPDHQSYTLARHAMLTLEPTVPANLKSDIMFSDGTHHRTEPQHLVFITISDLRDLFTDSSAVAKVLWVFHRLCCLQAVESDPGMYPTYPSLPLVLPTQSSQSTCTNEKILTRMMGGRWKSNIRGSAKKMSKL